MPPGRYRLSAHGKGMPYVPGPPLIVSVPATGSFVVDFVVDQDRRVVALSGVVNDAVTGTPVPGARIYSYVSGESAVTDREGRYRLYHLGPGQFRLLVSKPGYASRWIEDLVISRVGETRDFELPPAALLDFRVTDAEGSPVAGKLGVSFFPRTDEGHKLGATVALDEQGMGTYDQAPTGPYRIHIDMTGVGEMVVERVLVTGRQTIEVRLE